MKLNSQQLTSQLETVASGWVERALSAKASKGLHGRVLWWDKNWKESELRRELKDFSSWQVDQALNSPQSFVELQGASGPVWLVKTFSSNQDSARQGHRGLLVESQYVAARDTIGALFLKLFDRGLSHIDFQGFGCAQESWQGALVGAGIAAYSFKRVISKQPWPEVTLALHARGKGPTPEAIQRSCVISGAVNLTRHLVNLPSNVIYPQSLSQALVSLFKDQKHIKMEVWDHERLRKEGMGLLCAVGEASPHPPMLVKVHYRPSSLKSSRSQLKAFVGKGITFDSGGVNLKPASNMRWMKKDMGGAAALVGLLYYIVEMGVPSPFDFYYALAENVISGDAFCPGDILTSRRGLTVEIHNTDAEGRLALADALDVAITQKEKPSEVIDVATLTGAIKYGLGSYVSGVFANEDRLLESLEKAMNQVGDWTWGMPLVPKYASSLRSQVADMVNAVDGFGGAITAALFLEKFVGDVPWAHLDIYAWRDSAEGAISEQGGSGQAVQGLINYISQNKGRS